MQLQEVDGGAESLDEDEVEDDAGVEDDGGGGGGRLEDEEGGQQVGEAHHVFVVAALAAGYVVGVQGAARDCGAGRMLGGPNTAGTLGRAMQYVNMECSIPQRRAMREV